jgi:hypothetical protein
MQGAQHSLPQVGYGIVEASRHQKAFEPAPHPLYQVQVRAVGWQPLQPQPPRLPRRLTLSDHPGGMERSVVHNHHARLGQRSSLGQDIQVGEDLPTVSHEPSSTLYSNRSAPPSKKPSVPMRLMRPSEPHRLLT